MKLTDEIKEIIFYGSKEEKRILFAFDKDSSVDEIYYKYQLWSKSLFQRFFKYDDALFHKEMVENIIKVYKGEIIELDMAMFRGSAKTSIMKLMIAFFILNDKDKQRKHYKLMFGNTENLKNAIRGIYNLIIEVQDLYPEVFDNIKKEDFKKQTTMNNFNTLTGITVIGQTISSGGRGMIEDANRPDFLWFDDIEDRDILRSHAKLLKVKESIQEAITGRAIGGVRVFTFNYLSEAGNVHQIIAKAKKNPKAVVMIVPIITEKGELTWPDAYRITEKEVEDARKIDLKVRESIETIRKTADDFDGEYLQNPKSVGELFFNRDLLENIKPKQAISSVNGFNKYYDYNPSHRYAGGFDISKGVGLDSSTSVFIDFTQIPARVVATYDNNRINPIDFGNAMAQQGKEFGTCLLSPENNFETAAINQLLQSYPATMVYKMKVAPKSKIKVAEPNTYGWNTNSATKSTMLYDLQKGIEDGHLIVEDEKLLKELKTYTINDFYERKHSDTREMTRHFDLLTALAITWQMKTEARQTGSRADKVMKQLASQDLTNNY